MFVKLIQEDKVAVNKILIIQLAILAKQTLDQSNVVLKILIIQAAIFVRLILDLFNAA
jgi:hypothetical protein